MKFNIETYQFGTKFQLKAVKALFEFTPVKSDNTYFLIQLDEQSFVYVKEYGSVVFFNVPDSRMKELTDTISKTYDKWFVCESNTLVVDANCDLKVDFDEIVIPAMEVDLVHIIALNLAQSAILHYYQAITDEQMEETRVLSAYLERTGKVKLNQKKLAKYIGQTMSLRNKIADNLYIFESPPLAWTDVRLSQLDTMLSKELDFKNRYHGMQSSLSLIRENHEFYKDMLQHKHSSMLEWIIIILILFEVAQIFIK